MLHKYKPLIFDAKSKNRLLHRKGTYFYKQWFRPTYSIPALCSMALLVGIYVALFPITSKSVNAEGEEDYSISSQYDASTIQLEMTDNPDTKLQSSTNITAAGQIAYREYSFKATVGSTNGYRIYVQAADGYTGNLRGLANPQEQITGVGTDVVADANFPMNAWGYSLKPSTDNSARTYNTLPENGSSKSAALVTNATGSAGTNYKLIFAARIGGTKPADHYQTKVLLSLVARPSILVTLLNIDTMQELTPEVCADTTIGNSKALEDVRDHKVYWIARLLDGNCWMTQNLDYDGGGSHITNLQDWDISNTATQYFDPGLYVKKQPN